MTHDPTALRLYRSHRAVLVDYADRLMGDRANAEDIVQDAWLLFDRRPDSTVVRDSVGYLKRIVRNLAIDQLRRHARGAVHGGDQLEIAARTVPDDAPRIDVQIEARDEMRRVMEVIEAMPERQRQAITMYHFEGLKLREIADRLGVSRSLAHRLIAEGMEICDEIRGAGR